MKKTFRCNCGCAKIEVDFYSNHKEPILNSISICIFEYLSDKTGKPLKNPKLLADIVLMDDDVSKFGEFVKEGIASMNNKLHKISTKEKQIFLNKHPKLVEDAFARDNRLSQAMLINLARRELGYSEKTIKADILTALRKAYGSRKTKKAS